jgi:copper ion binding protein
MAAGMPAPIDSIDIPIQGMTCASCVGRVEKAIRSVEGVAAANVNLATERAYVEFAPSEANPAAVADAIRAAGYEPFENTIELKIDGMTCASCVNRVEKALGRVPGVENFQLPTSPERGLFQLARHDSGVIPCRAPVRMEGGHGPDARRRLVAR